MGENKLLSSFPEGTLPMNILFWLLKILLLIGLIFLGTALLDKIGYWSLPVCIILFLAGNSLINKKMVSMDKRKRRL
jgi:uncharacterized protein YybS (DUF2232 family)